MPIEATPREHVLVVAVALNATGDVTLVLLEGLVTDTFANEGTAEAMSAKTTTGEIRMRPTLRVLLRAEHADSPKRRHVDRSDVLLQTQAFPARDQFSTCLYGVVTLKVSNLSASGNGTKGAMNS